LTKDISAISELVACPVVPGARRRDHISAASTGLLYGRESFVFAAGALHLSACTVSEVDNSYGLHQSHSGASLFTDPQYETFCCQTRGWTAWYLACPNKSR